MSFVTAPRMQGRRQELTTKDRLHGLLMLVWVCITLEN